MKTVTNNQRKEIMVRAYELAQLGKNNSQVLAWNEFRVNKKNESIEATTKFLTKEDELDSLKWASNVGAFINNQKFEAKKNFEKQYGKYVAKGFKYCVSGDEIKVTYYFKNHMELTGTNVYYNISDIPVVYMPKPFSTKITMARTF